ncbi:hypothetical protein BUALT_Bualt04G0075000 [Buddleja alternifolia]|uniref:Retrotransposon Copia-like N-terminal domain-containing protein n=1 Tax=Buddleja alternifolia TaxID=168488 RepID=A0AAV6XXX0_9LAMI|nr:hypothetical protein BUALT_Bualt04G0075000 [Buddleja alternifolia]
MFKALNAKNKYGFVNGKHKKPAVGDSMEDAWMKCDQMVASWLQNSLSPKLQNSVTFLETAEAIWKELEHRFSQGNDARIQELTRDVVNLRQGNMDVVTYYSKLRELWDELDMYNEVEACTCGHATATIKARQREKVHFFLLGLNDSLSTRGKGHDQNGRNRPKCDHCDRTGHTKDRCFELIGYPPDWQNKNQSNKSRQGVYVVGTEAATDNPPTQSQGPVCSLTTAQYEALMSLLNQNKPTDATINLVENLVNENHATYSEIEAPVSVQPTECSDSQSPYDEVNDQDEDGIDNVAATEPPTNASTESDGFERNQRERRPPAWLNDYACAVGSVDLPTPNSVNVLGKALSSLPLYATDAFVGNASTENTWEPFTYAEAANDGIRLNQFKYARDVISEIGMDNAIPARTPIPVKHGLLSDSGRLLSDPTKTTNSSNVQEMASPFYLSPSENPGTVLVSQLLKGPNYQFWRRSMFKALNAKNKYGFVNGKHKKPAVGDSMEDAWMKCDQMVASWLQNSLSPKLQNSVTFLETVEAIWKELEHRFSQGNDARIQELTRDVVNLRQGNMDVLRELWDELDMYNEVEACTCGHATATIKARQREKVHFFLLGLNDSLSTVRSQIICRQPLPSIEEAYALACTEEKQQQAYSKGTIEAAAFNIKSSSWRGKGRDQNGRNRPKCDHCDRTGHTKDRCFELIGYPPDWQNKNQSNKSRRGVYVVGTEAATDNPPTQSQGPVCSLTTAQYEALMSLLNQNKPTDATINLVENLVNENHATYSEIEAPVSVQPTECSDSQSPYDEVNDQDEDGIDNVAATEPPTNASTESDGFERNQRERRPPAWLNDYACAVGSVDLPTPNSVNVLGKALSSLPLYATDAFVGNASTENTWEPFTYAEAANDGIRLNQFKYARDVISEIGMDNAIPARTPIPVKHGLLSDSGRLLSDPSDVRSRYGVDGDNIICYVPTCLTDGIVKIPRKI